MTAHCTGSTKYLALLGFFLPTIRPAMAISESGAGSGLGDAQDLSTELVFYEITGSLAASTDTEDMFKIYINDPDTFSATATERNSSGIDPALWLFDSGGSAIYMNDSQSGGNAAKLPAGDANSPSAIGIYYLAITEGGGSIARNSSLESLFDGNTGMTVWGPSGTSGAVDGTKWVGGAGFNFGDYTIALTSVGIPEPSALALFMIGAAGLLCRRRRT